ncbi:MAG: hypothetical protein MJ055_04890 [Phascolarctobacterium sp.]|nr:hypothetical protein [Phascolarctobacterium sp.]
MALKFEIDVLGKEKVDFTNKEGRHIEGTNIYCPEVMRPDVGVGKKYVHHFVPAVVISFDSIKLGLNKFEFNQWGRIVGIGE